MRIYIAAPLTKPDVCVNTKIACEAADKLLAMGHVPFVPHLTLIWHTLSPKDYETWMRWDAEWLAACDAVMRLPGESPGADREVVMAGSLGIPVYYNFADMPAR